MSNNSPWISELNKERVSKKLKKDVDCDIVIVGAGIAGISTAFFILENTDKKVILVDKYKLAHGATGHNAGHVVAYFERPFPDIAREYGLEMACQGKKDLESGWELFDHMYTAGKLGFPFTKVLGYNGYSTRDQVFEALEYSRLLREGGVFFQMITISEELDWNDIDKKYDGLYEKKSRAEILSNIESKDDQYIACKGYHVGCVNSALFCEGILEYLNKMYEDRFDFYEHTPINKVILKHDHSILDAVDHTLTAERVVLCTNGFEHLEIFNESGLDIDTKFHHTVDGVVGYMSAYLEKLEKEPFAGTYYGKGSDLNNPYFYITRRFYDFDEKPHTNLVSVGGPQFYLESRKEYDREAEYPEDAKEEIDDFVKKTYDLDPPKDFQVEFNWHGLMGYTKNMIRLVGEEPKNPVLLYNLGCNGVGILPSIFGGWKIGRMIAGDKFPSSIFDPK